MKYLLTGSQMKYADYYTMEKIGIPSLVLMERAALKIADIVMERFSENEKILVICGAGNNGGDGYAVARLLFIKGYDVSLLFVGNEDSRSNENLLQKRICDYYHIPIVNDFAEQEYTIMIDAIFGIGLSRNITGFFKEIINKMNSSKAYKIAVDIPSGIHDTTGMVMGIATEADLTIVIAYMKQGEVIQPGNAFTGEIVLADIGINDDALEQNTSKMFVYEDADFYERLPRRKKNSHKGTYGKIGIIAGSKGMSGAAYLCAKAAYMTGAGLVNIYTHEENRIVLQKLLPEAILTTYRDFNEEQLEKFMNTSDVICVGCGLGQSETSARIVTYVMQYYMKKMVVDADGINLLANNTEILNRKLGSMIITPHMKEMSRLLKCEVSELQKNRVSLLNNFIDKHDVTCVLKDARTLVGKKNYDVFVNTRGNNAMAKGGSGDVLAGITASLWAQVEDDFQAATLAVYLHGFAGDLAKSQKGSYSVLASDIIDAISDVLKKVV